MNEGNLLPGMIASLMKLSIGFLFLHGIKFQTQGCKETHHLGGNTDLMKLTSAMVITSENYPGIA
jgi:D-mannonate dehydratase